ncbi:hypothetical protein V6N12_007520 [Hibiscus sabdariffa]|uniref:Uncharacterized protein n=1 Tax=Hibiscus sabdariffa TaxID=183260 RepID=A0ABR2F227_9ROSI
MQGDTKIASQALGGASYRRRHASGLGRSRRRCALALLGEKKCTLPKFQPPTLKSHHRRQARPPSASSPTTIGIAGCFNNGIRFNGIVNSDRFGKEIWKAEPFE